MVGKGAQDGTRWRPKGFQYYPVGKVCVRLIRWVLKYKSKSEEEREFAGSSGDSKVESAPQCSGKARSTPPNNLEGRRQNLIPEISTLRGVFKFTPHVSKAILYTNYKNIIQNVTRRLSPLGTTTNFRRTQLFPQGCENLKSCPHPMAAPFIQLTE